jgi:hypothetical protein
MVRSADRRVRRRISARYWSAPALRRFRWLEVGLNCPLANSTWRAYPHTVIDKIKMRDGDTMLIMVKDGTVIHFTPNMSWPHSEFVKRTTGELPEGAWVGTVSRLDGKIAAISSKHFFGYQLPGPDWVQAAVREMFE